MLVVGYDALFCLGNALYYKATGGRGKLLKTIEEFKVWKVKSPVYYL